MRITVVGTGYVGLVAGACFAEVGHQVTCVDIDEAKLELLRRDIPPIFEAGLQELMQRNRAADRIRYSSDYVSAYQDAEAIFIGVGTPELPDGSADLSHIAGVARQIAENITSECLIVVKSTVPVGTNDKVEQFVRDFLAHDVRVEVASNPEFLAQGSAVHDTLHAARVVIGTESPWAEALLRRIYEPFGLPIVSVSRRSAEMIKYAANVFLALKISYMNDIANLCELVNADVADVAKAMSYDDRIGARFLGAGVGYGGSCFPKDTKALDWLARQHGYNLRTVRAAIDVNHDQKTILFRKASSRLITFKGLDVAVLGLTFKPGTDDLREAPSLDNVRLLLEQGADLRAYDPVGVASFKRVLPAGAQGRGTISYPEDARSALQGANVCFIFTEWPEVRRLTPHDFKSLMRTPLVYDGRNLFSPDDMREAGVEYYSVGRP
ncbi:MAG: UDP-glucose/GDP-mannose dehydrogenase family protein [Micropruina sp.]